MASSKLYVSNLCHTVVASDLEELFGSHGEILFIHLLDVKGWGVVGMSSQEDASKAKDALHGTEFKGRNIDVAFSIKDALR